MKKVTLLLLIFCLAVGASGGYGYYVLVLEDDTDDTDDNPKSSSPPIARINPSNPKIQANETILFSASDSTDSDGDQLSFTWDFEGDSKQYEGKTIERIYPDGGDF
nr:PKD domain-containing protein [Dehalococcoidia bacterium]